MLHLEYEISERDYLAAQRLAAKHSPIKLVRWSRSVIPLFGLALLAFFIQASMQRGFSWRGLPGAGFALFFISVPLMNRRALKKVYAKDTNMHGRLSLVVDEEGLQFRGPTFSSQAQWSHFASFFEDDKLFVLYQHSLRVINIIPKQSLTAQEITDLRGYFEGKIGRKKLRD